MQHRGSGCPDTSPRTLIRTTVNNDESPVEEVRGFDANAKWNLLLDRTLDVDGGIISAHSIDL